MLFFFARVRFFTYKRNYGFFRALGLKFADESHCDSEVFIFVTKESRDEAALWSSRGKEEKMHSLFSAGRIEIDLPTPED